MFLSNLRYSVVGVAVLFAVSWLPLGVFSLVADLYGETNLMTPHSLYVGIAACHVTAMTSAVSNPVVYGFLNSNIRHELCLLLPSRCAPVPPQPEDPTTRTVVGPSTQRRESAALPLVQNGRQHPARIEEACTEL